ncbi:MAG: hypothetical protein JSV60_04140, partial [Desulfobacterales bacterium]
MKSTIRNPQSAMLSAVYFPFTFISPSLVEATSVCFDRLVVYQPPFAKPQQALQPWVDTGFLDLRSPLEKSIDKKSVEAALRNFRSWGLFHEHADMAYLKMAGNDISLVDPRIARIVSDIRGKGTESSNTSDQGEFSHQLFLHLAQEFDQHSWELTEELRRVNHQYQGLQSAFRQDQNGQAHEPIEAEPMTAVKEDRGSFMIEKRMAAWNHVFQNDFGDIGLLLTDSYSALAYLLDEAQEKVEALRFNVTYSEAQLNQVPTDRPTWVDHLQEIFNTVLAMPWSRTLQKKIVQAGREMEAIIHHRTGANMRSHERSVSFRWYVVPDQVPQALLNRRCGAERGHEKDRVAKVKNTIVGMIEEGRPAGLRANEN